MTAKNKQRRKTDNRRFFDFAQDRLFDCVGRKERAKLRSG
jgi:hypothetical protein